MDKIIRKETQSGQVAQIIERQISMGELHAGEQLPSLRKLAQSLGVSLQVVKSAVIILENKSLIISRNRVGIFVNPKLVTTGRKNVMILSSFCKNPLNDYTNLLLSLFDENLWQNIKFTRCTIPREYITPVGLRYEIGLIRKTNPDCLIVAIPQLDRGLAELLKDLPFPVVFIGDFHKGIIEEVDNQIVENTAERVQAMMDVAISQGRRRIVMLAGLADVHYIHLLKKAGKEYAAKKDVFFQYFSYADLKCNETETIMQHRKEAMHSLLQDTQPDAVIIESFHEIDLFVKIFNEHSQKVSNDLMVITSSEMHPGLTYIKYDYSEFSKKAYELINSLMEMPDKNIGHKTLSGLITCMPLVIESKHIK